MAYGTPGVYVVEKSLFPPSVAQVETAIPAFIGYTEKAKEYLTDDLLNKPKRISSLKEYERFFGFGSLITVNRVDIGMDNSVLSTDISQQYILYDSLRVFFDNGGGDCFIISVGKYQPVPAFAKADFEAGLAVLKKVDEPTLILFPDATNLSKLTGYYNLQQSALAQCGELGDRFAVLDLLNYLDPNIYNDKTNFDKSNKEFRDNIGMSDLKYGAAYAPWINADITKNLTYADVRGALKRNNAPINLKTLTSTLPAADQVTINKIIDDYDMLIDDQTQIQLQTNAHFAPNVNIKTRYLGRVDDFKKDAYTPATNATIRTSFRKMMDETFMLIDMIDDLLFVVPPPILDDPELVANVAATATGLKQPLLDLVIINNSMQARDLVLSDAVPPPSVTDYPRQKLITHPEYTNPVAIAAWVNVDLRSAINSVVVDATDAKFKNIQATIAAAPTAADKDKLRIENMLFIEKELSTIFNQFYTAYDSILSFVSQKLQLLEGKLLASYPVYKNIMTAVNNSPTKLPPSAAVVGRYAYVDNTRGVWKAPANTDVKSLKSPGLLYDVDDKEQKGLNIDVDSGKSINIIRYFTGKGNLIWGARTLAGNDNEWRYVPVRRFFNMVEESCKKSTSWAVFEPNDAGTWVKVKGMIDNFLILQWRAGALQGAKPEDAFFVKVGLGETMTSLDILEGRMNVEIGMAVVRPAEFIILTFSHKMATS